LKLNNDKNINDTKKKNINNKGDNKLIDTCQITGLQEISNNGGGNCLFYALLDSFEIESKYAQNLREVICNYIEEDDYLLNKIIAQEPSENYLEKMRKNGEWGSNIETVAFSLMTSTKITIQEDRLTSNTTSANTIIYEIPEDGSLEYCDTISTLRLVSDENEIGNHYTALKHTNRQKQDTWKDKRTKILNFLKSENCTKIREPSKKLKTDYVDKQYIDDKFTIEDNADTDGNCIFKSLCSAIYDCTDCSCWMLLTISSLCFIFVSRLWLPVSM